MSTCCEVICNCTESLHCDVSRSTRGVRYSCIVRVRERKNVILSMSARSTFAMFHISICSKIGIQHSTYFNMCQNYWAGRFNRSSPALYKPNLKTDGQSPPMLLQMIVTHALFDSYCSVVVEPLKKLSRGINFKFFNTSQKAGAPSCWGYRIQGTKNRSEDTRTNDFTDDPRTYYPMYFSRYLLQITAPLARKMARLRFKKWSWETFHRPLPLLDRHDRFF